MESLRRLKGKMMGFGSTVTSSGGTPSPQQALEMAKIHLTGASSSTDPNIAIRLCHEAERLLEKAVKRTEHRAMLDEIATAYVGLGRLLESLGRDSEAQDIYKKAEKLGGTSQGPTRSTKSSRASSATQSTGALLSTGGTQVSGPSHRSSVHHQTQVGDIAMTFENIYEENARSPSFEYKLPEPDERLRNTQELAYCLGLLRVASDDILDPATQKWLAVIRKDTDEQERLRALVTDVIRAFKRDEPKDAKAVAEVVCLASVLEKEDYRYLLKELYSGVEKTYLLDYHQLHGLAQLIQDADPGHLDADDLVKILQLLNMRLNNTHNQSSYHMYQLTIALSRVLDAMADAKVTGLDRKSLHEPLSTFLGGLKKSSDPYLVYQAAYAHQALLYVPDNESAWQSAMRHSGKVFKGVSGMVSAVKGIDLAKFIDSLEDIQKGLSGASKAFDLVMDTYKDVKSLVNSGQTLRKSLEGGLSFQYKRDWYAALRGADVLIRDGELSKFKKLVCDAPCRLDPGFQWGVCQRLGEIAGNPLWDEATCLRSIEFLGEIYKNDNVWGRQSSVKQWILNILMQLASSESTLQVHKTIIETLLHELETNGDDKKQTLYRQFQEKGPVAYPLNISPPEFASPSLLDRVQSSLETEAVLRILRQDRTKESVDDVYIPLQAKAGINAPDDTRFPLMERVKEFLEGDQKVFLLLGDSGAGKSTFSRKLESDLWQTYERKTGRIPLYINLPTIDHPEHDMISKQLRRAGFTECQIQEMKQCREFILICDGYDECQQTHNLYVKNGLNQEKGWDAKMVISCRSEYLRPEYRDWFQLGVDRNQTSKVVQFQEAVIAPFSTSQIQDYIDRYTSVYEPQWEAKEYNQALENIPSLKDLVKNPFLMKLSLEILPRMDTEQQLSATRVTQVARVTMYDLFLENWLERGRKRIAEKNLTPQAAAAFEILCNDGLTKNGIDFLKRLAVAIYKEQDGRPIVKFSSSKDEGSWKAKFFSREDMKLILLNEACPVVRNGNLHGFLHRSVLEYVLALAVFDPQDWTNVSSSDQDFCRESSVNSILSLTVDMKPDPNSPLVWKNFVKDHSLLHFLKERAQQEPIFKKQLLGYIEHSKKNKKWSTAAANAITILVRAGVSFSGADLRCIRVPGADLRLGIFDSAQLQGADLTSVKMQGIWLRQANLGRAWMKDVEFGIKFQSREDSIVHTIAYSPNGRSLASGLDSGGIKRFLVLNNAMSMTLSGHRGPVRCVTYSPSGEQIASCGDDKTLRLWMWHSRKCQRILTGHTDAVTCVKYSPKGGQIVTSSKDRTLRLWDPRTGDCIRTLSGHDDEVTSIVYSPNGNEVISGSADCTVRLWDVESGKCSNITIGHRGKIRDIAYSPREDIFASASEDKTVRLWDKETMTCRRILQGYGSSVNCVVFLPKGDRIASGSQDGIMRLWDIGSGTCINVFRGHFDAILCIAYWSYKDVVVTGSMDRLVRFWNIPDETSHFTPSGHSLRVNSVKCSPNGRQIASGSDDRTIKLLDAESGECIRTLTGHSSSVMSVAYSPHGNQIASGSLDSSVRLWDIETGSCQRILTGNAGKVHCVAYSPQGHLIVSANQDMTVRLWDVVTGECTGILIGHTDEAFSVAFSPSGAWVASGHCDGVLRLWNVESLGCRRFPGRHSKRISHISFSPKGHEFASASGDGSVRLWDVETGNCRLTLSGHRDIVTSITYSFEGDLLVSGSQDKTVRIWDIASGQCRAVMAVMRLLRTSVQSVHWRGTSDASYLVTGSYDGSVLMWKITKEAGQQHREQLQWNSGSGARMVSGASMQYAYGLSDETQLMLLAEASVRYYTLLKIIVAIFCVIPVRHTIATLTWMGFHWSEPCIVILDTFLYVGLHMSIGILMYLESMFVTWNWFDYKTLIILITTLNMAVGLTEVHPGLYSRKP